MNILIEIFAGLAIGIFLFLLVDLNVRGRRKLSSTVEHPAGKERVGIDADWRWPTKEGSGCG